jgi:DNA replication and repair protein RecF
MTLVFLEISHFRNLSHVIINPCEEINIIYGKNGSGKTSLLESIYHLGYCRSFRSRSYDHIIMRQQEKLCVFGRVKKTEADHAIGIERYQDGKLGVKINKKPAESIAELAEVLPIQLIDFSAYQLICAGPKTRRQLIDWGIFHQQPDFFNLWGRLQRVVKQRNAALKIKPCDIKAISLWNKELVETSLSIDKLRREYMAQYGAELFAILKKLPIEQMDLLSAIFYSGWNEQKNLADILASTIESDWRFGCTQHGAHRADLRFEIAGVPVQNVLSRGQQKLFIYAARLAQASLLKKTTGKKSLFLIDDLPSELDKEKLSAFCDVLAELDAQLFITGIDLNSFDDLFKNKSLKTFHVKQGEVIEAKYDNVIC